MTTKNQIFRRAGVRNHAELKRRGGIRTSRAAEEKERSGGVIAHIGHAAERLTRRTVKFIRWLKNHLDLERGWDDAVARLSLIYQHSR